MQCNIAGYDSSMCDCGKRRMRFISRSVIAAQALTSKRQGRPEGWVSTTCRSD